jgi:hypothetical protein
LEVLTCPVLGSFLLAVLQVPVTSLNKDLYEDLREVKLRAEQERVGIEIVRKRALRAYELAYNAVLSTTLDNLEVIPEVRAAPETFDWYIEHLLLRVDDAIVENVEYSLVAQVVKGPQQMQWVTMKRLQQGGMRLMGEIVHLKQALRDDDRHVLGRMGGALFDICQVMAIGMSRQLIYAEELLRA